MSNNLPDKPSALIRVALADLTEIEKDNRYCIAMDDHWHEPVVGGLCCVCLAGAVMALTLDTPHEEAYCPLDFLPDERNKLRALDMLRYGHVFSAFAYMDLPKEEAEKLGDLRGVHPITPHNQDRDAFHADMQALADKLEEAGL